MRFGVIRASVGEPEVPQGGNLDPLLTSQPHYYPHCTDEKVEPQRGVRLGLRRTRSPGSPLLSPWPCNQTPGGNQTHCPQNKNTIWSCCGCT